MFIYNPALLLIDTTWLIAIRVSITAIIGVCMIGMATEGYMFTKIHNALRIITFAGALMLITANVYQDVIGILILIAVLVVQKMLSKKQLEGLK